MWSSLCDKACVYTYMCVNVQGKVTLGSGLFPLLSFLLVLLSPNSFSGSAFLPRIAKVRTHMENAQTTRVAVAELPQLGIVSVGPHVTLPPDSDGGEMEPLTEKWFPFLKCLGGFLGRISHVGSRLKPDISCVGAGPRLHFIFSNHGCTVCDY